jgi:hypothetical protein
MAQEDDTQEGRTRRLINDEVQLPTTGVITAVHEHTDPDDRWNHHVDVRIGPETNPRKVPVATAVPELIAPPRGEDHPDGPDMALVQYLNDDGTQRPIVTHILYNDQDRAPLGTQGDVRVRRGDLYTELAADGSHARLAKKSGDMADPDLVVEIDESGTIRIGNPDGDLQPIARKGDSVEVSDPDSGTLSGTITEGSGDVESS